MNHKRPSCHPARALLGSALLAAAALLAAGSAIAEPAGNSDLAKEQRWRAQIVDGLLDGEAVDLQAGDLTFLGLYTEADEPTGRAAIIIHGIGVHPDWPQVVIPGADHFFDGHEDALVGTVVEWLDETLPRQ